MNAPVRLRQICLIASQLEPVIDDLIAVFGLQVCYGKADLTRYGVPKYEIPSYQKVFFETLGLASAILPVGESFLEIVAPIAADNAGARYLQRRGPGGYMVITEVDNLAPYAERTSAQGVRLAGRVDYPVYGELQLDPRDIGSAILSFSQQLEGIPFDGGWFPAGPDFREKITPGYAGIVSAVLSTPDPDLTAAKWAASIGRTAEKTDSGMQIRLDGADLLFVPGKTPRLSEIGIAATNFTDARARALKRGLAVDGSGAVALGGILIRAATPFVAGPVPVPDKFSGSTGNEW